MNYSIDFGNFIQPVAGTSAPLYASVDGVAHPLGTDECVFQDRATGEVHVMTLQVLQALDLCREFRPLDEHCAAVAQRLSGLTGQAEAVRRVLEGLIQRGLILSDADYLARLAVPSAPVQAPLRAVFIRANGNATQLDRLLDSIAQYERTHQARLRYVLLDGGPDGARDATVAAVKRFRASGALLEHVDRAARVALVEKLAAQLPHAEDTLRATLGADTLAPGALHDLAALLGAGGRWVLLDAADVLPLTRPADAKPGLDLVDAGAVTTQFFGSAAAALGVGVPPARDPIAAHLELAGQSLGTVLAQPEYAPTRASLRGVAPSRASRLFPGTRIAATVVGRRGQSATRRVANLFLLDGEARAQFWHDRAQYQRHLDGACLWRGVARARLVEPERVRPFMVDGTQLVAPLPAGATAADPLFGVLTRALDPRSAVAMTSDTLGRDEGGAHDAEALRRPDAPAFSDWLADFVGARLADVRAEDAGARAWTLTGWLDDVASASAATRAELVDEFVRFRRADLIARLQSAATTAAGAPAWWQSDIRELVVANGKALIEGAAPCLDGWPADLDAGACAERFGAELRDYAALLAVWPDVTAQAAELGERALGA